MDHFNTSEQRIFSAGMKPKSRLHGTTDVLTGLMQTRCSMNQKKQRRDFTDEFKNDAVKLVTENGYSCMEAGRRLGVNHTNISRWVRQYRNQMENPTQNSGSVKEMEDELKRLRKENKRLLMEREILKKAAAFFANESK
jgi:transposase